jgi:N-acetylmuramoyl-L-alanine amidase
MNTLNQIALLLFCLVFLNGSYAQSGKYQEKKSIVVIDPGHGGQDSGAMTRNGIREKDITLNIASKIVVLNNKLFKNPLILFLTR